LKQAPVSGVELRRTVYLYGVVPAHTGGIGDP
jgi:hypothetical protein